MIKKDIEMIKKISLLYVEDDDNTRERMIPFLETRVAKLYVSKDGEEGLQLYKKYNPDLVLSDIQMPKLDGISMSKYIKEFDPDAKIIILTAFNESKLLFDAIKVGVENYKIKPIDIKDLYTTIGKIARDINLKKENKEIYNTLTQYKDIVDARSILSKTDKNGIITYVNEPFEKVSGYTKEELIGKPHRIIRHKDTKEELFKDLWKTIQNKKTWSGIIKNKKKNGDYYIVDTIIKPIVDIKGEIQEFIALRNDITDLEDSKEFFRNKNEKKILDLKESIRKAKIYKNAINKSNIIIRITKDKKITYVNNAFCKVSGYSREELIGQPYSLIKDKNLSDKEYTRITNEMIEHLEAGKDYERRVSNTAKDGSTFHCKNIVFPLRDKAGNIVEYMGVRHDITEIIDLHNELEDTQRELIYKLGEIGETRSKETGNHVKRVAEYSKLLGRKVGLSENEINTLFTASPMHDIGKVGIPDSILHKPGKLAADEWDIMQSHSEIGYEILRNSNRPILKSAAIISYTHHEKWNGKGYPRGLKGEDIHIFGRITALADVFDALGSDRCYKKAWPLDKILKLFEDQKGKHFDPKLVDIFFSDLDDFLEIRDKYKD